MSPDGDAVTAEVQWRDLVVLPKEIRVRLRSGDGRPLHAAFVNGTAVAVTSQDTIALPLKKSATYHITGEFNQ